MNAEAAWNHHRRTLHRPHALSAARVPLDWSNRPRSDKRYRGVFEQALPVDVADSVPSAVDVLSGQATPGAHFLDRRELARLLFYAAGVVRRRRADGLTLHFRAAPSAGALYPVEAYVICGDLPDLPAGVYHFEPVSFALQPLREGDWRGRLADAAADADAAGAPLTVALTGVPWRTVWKYGERGYRHLFWDAGAVAANLVEAAAAAGLPSRLLSGFVDAAVADLLGVADGQAPAAGGEVPLALLPIGAAGAAPPDAPDPPPLSVDVEPLSREVIDEPGLWEAHHAGDLDSATTVEGWRAQLEQQPAAPAGDAQPPDASPGLPGGREPLEHTILRRGSTRRFAHQSVVQSALEWPLAVASRHVAGDIAPAGQTRLARFVSVHAVEGRPVGAYRHDRDGLAAVRTDVTRELTAGLCLGQPLGGDAAYTVFFTAGLDEVLASGGARGYRVAQLEAGVAAERLQLAAFAAGVGATGQTFFDEQVRDLFGADGWPMLTAAVGVPAYRPRPGRRPSEA